MLTFEDRTGPAPCIWIRSRADVARVENAYTFWRRDPVPPRYRDDPDGVAWSHTRLERLTREGKNPDGYVFGLPVRIAGRMKWAQLLLLEGVHDGIQARHLQLVPSAAVQHPSTRAPSRKFRGEAFA